MMATTLTRSTKKAHKTERLFGKFTESNRIAADSTVRWPNVIWRSRFICHFRRVVLRNLCISFRTSLRESKLILVLKREHLKSKYLKNDSNSITHTSLRPNYSRQVRPAKAVAIRAITRLTFFAKQTKRAAPQANNRLLKGLLI